MTTLTAPGGALPLPKTIFTFISDPGHGWLIVAPGWLDAVGLTLADISTFSYQRADGILALEEDCDARAFIRAFEQRFGDCFELREIDQESTEIRNWPQISHDVPTSEKTTSVASARHIDMPERGVFAMENTADLKTALSDLHQLEHLSESMCGADIMEFLEGPIALLDQVADCGRSADVITYEIQRFPMIADSEDGYTLFDAVDHAGQTWEFIDVTVTKRVNDCLVDEVASVDCITSIDASDAVLKAFASAFPMATTEDHLEDVAHLSASAA